MSPSSGGLTECILPHSVHTFLLCQRGTVSVMSHVWCLGGKKEVGEAEVCLFAAAV